MERILLIGFLISFGVFVVITMTYNCPLKLANTSLTLSYISEKCIGVVAAVMLCFELSLLTSKFFDIVDFLFTLLGGSYISLPKESLVYLHGGFFPFKKETFHYLIISF